MAVVLDQGIDLKSSAKFTNAPDLARNRGPYHFATWSDAVDAVKKRPSAPAASLPAPNSPSRRATCCLLRPQILHFPMHFMCAFDQAVFVFDGGEGGGVSEPAPMRVPLEA